MARWVFRLPEGEIEDKFDSIDVLVECLQRFAWVCVERLELFSVEIPDKSLNKIYKKMRGTINTLYT